MVRNVILEDENSAACFFNTEVDSYYYEGKLTAIKKVPGPNNKKKQYRLNRIRVKRRKN